MRHRLHRIVKGAVELILGVGMIAVPERAFLRKC